MGVVAIVKTSIIVVAALTVVPFTVHAQRHFSTEESNAVARFWSEPGRHIIQLPASAEKNGPYTARMTPAGSTWLRDYYTARGDTGKIIPTQDPKSSNARHAAWDAWIEARYCWDEYQAALEAQAKNEQYLGRSVDAAPKTTANPGPCPADLKALAGEPPKFVDAVMPREYITQFDDLQYRATDHAPVRRKYAYYRFSDGIMDGGQSMRGRTIDDLRPLFAKAGVSEAELKVMAAVSLLEGGFDSINTYDTGFVSVGFIQFASLREGGGSLGQVLLMMKRENPKAFQADFRQFGIDVTTDGKLVALELPNQRERVGSDANHLIIRDKRLASVFVRAGRRSEAFRICQIKVAKEMYYPADDVIQISTPEGPQNVRLGDIFKTEAGLATLMDRKVNTGKYGNLSQICSRYMADYGFDNPSELAALEFQLIRALRYRKDYLAPDYALSKPRDLGIVASRGGKGSKRTGG